MKRFLFLGLIYALNIILFLFAKSAGAAVIYDKVTEVSDYRGRMSFTLVGHQESIHTKTRAIGCLKEAASGKHTVAIELDDKTGEFKNCTIAVSRIVKR